MNPPYGREIKKWVKKAYEESQKGALVVALLPSRTDTKWFHRYVYKKAEIRFIKGRLKFKGAKYSAPFPSMIVVYKTKQELYRKALETWGEKHKYVWFLRKCRSCKKHFVSF